MTNGKIDGRRRQSRFGDPDEASALLSQIVWTIPRIYHRLTAIGDRAYGRYGLSAGKRSLLRDLAIQEKVRIETELAAGTALTFMGQKNIHYGVDRIVAITADGRGYVWHDLNDCGEKSYDGTVVGEDCPPRPDDAAETD